MLFQCPKLTPLQSRFVASFGALILLGLIFWSLATPHFAYATELDVDGSGRSRDGDDHNWHRIWQQQQLESDGLAESGDAMEEELVKRAVIPEAIGGNNVPAILNIQPGNTSLWMFSKELLLGPHTPVGSGLPSDPGVKRDIEPQHIELRKRQQGGQTRTIYVSMNTCLQPTWNGTGPQTIAPPQLTLYVANSSDNANVGPGGQSQIVAPLQEGFANVSVNATGDWYMSVHAPELPEGFVGVWNYELAVSIDAYYHAAEALDPFLFLVDTDVDSALLVTNNLTQTDASSPVFRQWLNASSPFTMFAANMNDTGTMGIMQSYCGWSYASQIAANQQDPEGTDSHVQMGMITRGLGNKPKEQFYITHLNGSSNYNGVLAMAGNSTKAGPGVVGGGGKIWPPVYWSTKSDGNCALLFNLTFCDEVAYAVPSNPNDNTYDIAGMRQLFDNYTSTFYQQFEYSLQQVACDTSSDAQYSLAKNCNDCSAAYKQWLCAVSIPRCEDFSNNASYLLPRNVGQAFPNGTTLSDDYLNTRYIPMSEAPTIGGSLAYNQTYNSSLATNSSRNPALIDLIQPGPYKEVLPCEDLCWSLVQSCPAVLGFACPYAGRGLEAGYGKRSPNGVTCSYLGAVYFVSDAGGSSFAPVFRAVILAALATLLGGLV